MSGVYRGYIGIMEKKVSPMFLLLLTDYLGASSLRLALNALVIIQVPSSDYIPRTSIRTKPKDRHACMPYGAMTPAKRRGFLHVLSDTPPHYPKTDV